MLDGGRLLQDALQQVLKALPQMSSGCVIEKRPDVSLTASSLRSAMGRSALSAIRLRRQSVSRGKLSDLGQYAGQVKEVFLGKFIYLRISALRLKHTRELMRVVNSLPVRFDRK